MVEVYYGGGFGVMLGTKNKKGGKAYAMPWEWGIFGVVPSKGLMIVLNFYFYFYEKKKFIWTSFRVLRLWIRVSGYSWIRIMICVTRIL